MKVAKLIVINAAVLAALLIGINVISAVILALIPVGRTHHDARAFLPTYRNHRAAEAIFLDYRRSKQLEFVPFLEWRRLPYAGPTTRVGHDGDRVNPSASGASHVRSRVVRFFGGSTMWGTGADDDGTIPAIYQRLHPRERVFNHGETGYNTRQNLERLINIINQGEPVGDVVFYEGFNDVGTLCRADVNINGQDQESRMRAVLDRAQSKRISMGPSLGDAVKALLYGHTERLTLALGGRSNAGDEEFGNYGTSSCARDPAKARRVARTVLNNLRIAATLVRAAGGRFVAILQPVAYLGVPRIDYLHLHRKKGKDVRAVYQLWRADARRVPWLYDLTSAFDGDRYIYFDPVHVSATGNQIIARKISQILAQQNGYPARGPLTPANSYGHDG